MAQLQEIGVSVLAPTCAAAKPTTNHCSRNVWLTTENTWWNQPDLLLFMHKFFYIKEELKHNCRIFFIIIIFFIKHLTAVLKASDNSRFLKTQNAQLRLSKLTLYYFLSSTSSYLSMQNLSFIYPFKPFWLKQYYYFHLRVLCFKVIQLRRLVQNKLLGGV